MLRGREWQGLEQMFSLFNPYVLVGFVLTLIGVYSYGHHSGYQERVTEDQAEIERLNTEARAKEAELGQKLARASNQLKQAKNVIQSKQTDIDARIDSGELRLPSSCGVQTSADARTARGTENGGQSESDRQAIKDIVALTTEGDKAILERNACIDLYNTVRSQVNEVGK